jgi:hypothetical protein
MFNNEVSDLKESLKNVIKNGVDTRIITPPHYTIEDNKIDITHEFIELNCPSKVLKVPFIKLVVRDNKEMLLTVSKFSGENVLEETAIGIWNQYSGFVETISGVYEIIWSTNLFNQLKDHKILN